jgi:hypothetical protein
LAKRLLHSMGRRGWSCGLVNSFWRCLGATVLCLGLTAPVAGQTLLNGQVANAVTKVPIPGATVKLFHGNQELGAASSDARGNFMVSCTLPRSDQPQNLTLQLEHAEFEKASLTPQAVGGKFTQQSYALHLLPRGLIHCQPGKGRFVVVGHFQAPMGVTYSELPQRIATALTYDLLTRLQKLHLQANLQPKFLACEEAKSRLPDQGKLFAQALHADVFICGNVIQAEKQFNIRTFVSDSHGLFEVPLSFINQNVDLNDPGAAELQPETHAAVLAAVAVGFEKEEKFAEGVQATLLAEKLLEVSQSKQPDLAAEIDKIRGRCQARLPHQGLLAGGGQ